MKAHSAPPSVPHSPEHSSRTESFPPRREELTTALSQLIELRAAPAALPTIQQRELLAAIRERFQKAEAALLAAQDALHADILQFNGNTPSMEEYQRVLAPYGEAAGLLLLRLMESQSAVFKGRAADGFRALGGRATPLVQPLVSAMYANFWAHTALCAIGPLATPAIPLLIEDFCGEKRLVSQGSLEVLAAIGIPAVAPVIKSMRLSPEGRASEVSRFRDLLLERHPFPDRELFESEIPGIRLEGEVEPAAKIERSLVEGLKWVVRNVEGQQEVFARAALRELGVDILE